MSATGMQRTPGSPSPGAVPAAPRRALRLGAFASPETMTLLVLLAVLVVLSIATTDNFLDVDNLRAIVRAAALTAIVAIGLTFVTLSGNFFSLSLGQTAAACGVVFAMMLRDGWPAGLALLVVLALAVAIGCAQGVVVAAGANPIIVTLGAGGALAGLTGIIAGGKGIATGSTSLDWLGDSRPLGFPIPTYAFVVIAILAVVFLARHRAGRALMLVGSNRLTAAATGLSFRRATVLAFSISAACCAVVAVLTVTQFNRADGGQFDDLTFDALAAVLVGGAALQGGEGSPAGTALGALFIATLANFMVLHDYSYGVRLTIQGVVVVLAVTAFHIMRQRRNAR
ncbi:ABC transporter permease [Conexibacter sp. CPCC 206217]|uniref:ABC transporter permease n=1 Tax=Conexibacter sp. CPCC 206217 TaxID=3064574 RepID=UPI002727F1E6|nr:ABC transporter permease [Conexibacter sp. CPCC 206217]MDO8212596.1 ABC transporter permease [Conexibacter sp. CPCC 206217]